MKKFELINKIKKEEETHKIEVSEDNGYVYVKLDGEYFIGFDCEDNEISVWKSNLPAGLTLVVK